MKKMNKTMWILAASTLALTSCMEEQALESQAEQAGMVNIEIAATSSDAVKTHLDNTLQVKWDASGEALQVIELAGSGAAGSESGSGVQMAVAEAASKSVAADGSTALFNVAFPQKTADGFHYWGIYPAANFIAENNADPDAFQLQIPAAQTPGADTFDKNADLLVSSRIAVDAQPESMDFAFARPVAVVEMTLKGMEDGEQLTEVVFSSKSAPLAGKLTFNLNTGKVVAYGTDNVSEIKMTTDLTTAKVGTKIYFTALPCTLADFTVLATTDKAIYTKTVDCAARDFGFKANTFTSFSVNGMTRTVPNPNNFTYVRWGNNLGEGGQPLLPLEKYGNQFRAVHGTGTLKMKVVESDIPKGRPVKYALIKNSMTSSIAVNEKSGRLEVYTKDASETKNILSFAFIQVTVGEGETAVTRKFPVFADFCGAQVNGHQINCTPFAVKLNPKTGGRASVLSVTDAEGNDVTANVGFGFRTNMCYFNVNGPEAHTNESFLKKDAEHVTFLAGIWENYFNAVGKKYNCYSSAPMSWWANQKDLSLPAAYIDNVDKAVVVNPDKFVDAAGNYADGVVYMTQAFDPTGGSSDGDNAIQVNRLFLWLDPNYTE